MGIPLSGRQLAQRQRQMWTPRLEMGDVAAWFDFSDPATTTWATGISQMRGQVGIPYQEQGNTSNQPGFGQINGRRCASFNGSNHFMMMFTAGNTTTMSNSFVVGGIFSVNAAGTDARPFTWIREAGGNDYDNSGSITLLYRSAANTWSTYQNGASRASSSGCTDGEVFVWVMWSDGTNFYHLRNGVQTASGTWGTISLSTGRFHFGIYATAPSVTDYRGLMGEMVAFRGGSLARAQKLGGYLAARWNHQGRMLGPYALSPPLIGG